MIISEGKSEMEEEDFAPRAVNNSNKGIAENYNILNFILLNSTKRIQ